MTFQQLSFVAEVAKCESINKAAERLYTHQSNVSNTIKQLEDELGIQIFQRTKKGVSVTNEGREFLGYAEEIINKKDFVENLYAVRNRRQRQYLDVSSMRAYFLSTPIIQLQDYLSRKDIPPTYIRLKKRSFSAVLEDVASRKSDLGIVFLPKSQKRRIQRIASAKGLDYFPLGDSHMSAVMRENHPVLTSEPLAHIAEYPYVIAEETENFGKLYDESSDSISQLFQEPPNVVISINESAASQDIIAHSDAFFISCTAWRHSQHYAFSSVPLAGDDNILSHYYIIRKNYEPTPLTEMYLEELKKMFGKL